MRYKLQPITRLTRYFSPLRLHEGRGKGGKRGQSMLFVALMFVVLIGVVGLAVDGAIAYAYSVAVERGAAAASLAGAPYMPAQFNAPSPNDAFDRAVAEAARNGYVNGQNGAQVIIPNQSGAPTLSVTIKQQVPTFFMQALGFPSLTVSRTAVAGYRPPIALGQPGAQLGSTVATLGAGGNFYFPRFKGWDNIRSEGDAFTPNPLDNDSAGAGTSTDVHQISDLKGTEDPQVACNGSGSLGAAWALPCRGGFNTRIFVPANTSAELDIYNASNAPDFGTKGVDANGNPVANRNYCDNSKNVSTCNAHNPPYWYHEDDNGAQCPCKATQAKLDSFNAAGYTLFKVNDLFLRQNDSALVQTKILPIDATNWDGNNGGTGKGATTTPSYVNVNTDKVITQTYVGGATGSAPLNMQMYHSWTDINNYDGVASAPAANADTNLIQRKTAGGWADGQTLDGGPNGTTYRLRIDALKYDGTLSNSGHASKGWAVRAVTPNTSTPCVGCQVAAWQDVTVYTPLDAGTGVVPMFELPKDYAGATIDVDVFDVGDSGGNVNLSILDPSQGLAIAQTSPLSNLNIYNMGINRFNADQTCASGCVAHTGNQAPIPKAMGPIAHSQAYQATYEAANSGYTDANGATGPEYQGSWIRIEIPIPANYNPPAYPNDFWKLQYVNTGGASDTFTFAVQAKGGPVHIISS